MTEREAAAIPGDIRAQIRRISVILRVPELAIGVFGLAVLLLAGFFLPLPYDPIEPNPSVMMQPPSGSHWFGTDMLGFDVFSRTIASASRDIPLAAIGTIVAMAIGVPLGLLASSKGKSGERIMRALDAFQAFPLLILGIAVVTLMGNRIENVVVAIVLINTPRFMRLVRAEALSLRESRFVEAARAMGASNRRILFRHLLPNVTDISLVQFSLSAARALIVIASLGFLGIGVSPPDPSWGLMLQAGARNISSGQWWLSMFPGLAIVAAVISFNLLADGLQKVFSGRSL
jgi:peptide/nickel transport system permease protein